MKKTCLLILAFIMSICMGLTAWASDNYSQKKITTVAPGATVNVTFQYTGEYSPTCYYSIKPDDSDPFLNDEFISDADYSEDIYPFENTKSNVVEIREYSSSKEVTKSITIGGLRVKKGLPDGYYAFNIYRGSTKDDQNEIVFKTRIYVKKGTKSEDETEEKKTPEKGIFAIGENQPAPSGRYPNVMNFEINVRNTDTIVVHDVNVSMVCEADSTKFPFCINEANYDRHYDQIGENETVIAPYSMAIREDVYTGYYPIKLNISYKKSGSDNVTYEEDQFFVYVINKDKAEEEKKNDFNANDRVKARLVVDSFRTEPADVFAGQDFDLIVNMKNASNNVDASNIMFSFESEKASDSPVFTTHNGSNSVVVDSLKAGAVAELRLSFSAKAGVDQRAYFLNIAEKYDSPEFKNAEEKVSIDIPVHQIAKFNMGNVEILPESISVGDEANVMFPINNTGKVLLYNVMARFEADSIQTHEAYIGNIKPGETGNVDVMLKGISPTMDEGDINVIISYEDENGNITEEKKKVNIFVNEAFDESAFVMDDMGMAEEEAQPIYKKAWFWIAAIALVAGAITAAVLFKKKPKTINIDEDNDENTDENK